MRPIRRSGVPARKLLVCIFVVMLMTMTGFIFTARHKDENKCPADNPSSRLAGPGISATPNGASISEAVPSGTNSLTPLRDCCPEVVPSGTLKVALNKKSGEQIRELFEDITLLNLINGLNLTKEQTKQIIQYNKKVQLLKEQTEQVNNKTIEDIIDAYTALESTLEKNEVIPKHIEHRAYTMEQEVKEILKELMVSVTVIEKELTGILLDAQVEIINTFNPCLIPPKDLKNPVRAGQVENGQTGLDLLRRIRTIPYEVFEDRKSEMVERYLDRVQEHFGKLTDQEKKKESERSFRVMEKARAMSDKEFELNGPDLVKEFVNVTKKTLQKDKELQKEIERIQQVRHGGLSRIGRYLFNPRIVPILEKRLELIKKQ